MRPAGKPEEKWAEPRLIRHRGWTGGGGQAGAHMTSWRAKSTGVPRRKKKYPTVTSGMQVRLSVKESLHNTKNTKENGGGRRGRFRHLRANAADVLGADHEHEVALLLPGRAPSEETAGMGPGRDQRKRWDGIPRKGLTERRRRRRNGCPPPPSRTIAENTSPPLRPRWSSFGSGHDNQHAPDGSGACTPARALSPNVTLPTTWCALTLGRLCR